MRVPDENAHFWNASGTGLPTTRRGKIEIDCSPDKSFLNQPFAAKRASRLKALAGRISVSIRFPGAPWQKKQL